MMTPHRHTAYETLADLPQDLPLFPLPGALLFAREVLPLNVFEPRYLAMADAVLGGNRLIGIIQPRESDIEPANAATNPGETDAVVEAGEPPALMGVGCAARLISFQEASDNRYLISLRGICRFDLGTELPLDEGGFRRASVDFKRFDFDLALPKDAGRINRTRLLEVVREYLENNNMDANWDAIHQTPDESLINYLCMVSPFGIRERQALLEAPSLVDRTDMMIALAEMLIARGEGPETPVH